jgi:hypothetical protein
LQFWRPYLLPSLAKAKEEANRAICINNLKEWGLAMSMYADDNGGYYPASRDTNYVDAPDKNPVGTEMYAHATESPPIGLSDWFNALPPYVAGVPLWKYGANSISNNVFTYSRSIYICPTAAAMSTVPPVRFLGEWNAGCLVHRDHASSRVVNISQFVAHPRVIQRQLPLETTPFPACADLMAIITSNSIRVKASEVRRFTGIPFVACWL